MFDLSGRAALVTGGSRGLGREMAGALAGQGADVALCSRNLDEAQAAAERIAAETGRQVVAYRADVCRAREAEELVRAAAARLGRIDILINNAGSGLRRPILDMTDEDWDGVLRVCLYGPFYVGRAVAPLMIRQGRGRIINISSTLGSIALPDRSAYCSAKGGLLQLTRVMALEWAAHGITVNAICPGPFKTANNLLLQQDPGLYESYLSLIPQHRWAELPEIRAAAVFLASDEASFVTGTALYVDGGWTAHAGLPLPGAAELSRS